MARHGLLIGVSRFGDQRLATLNAPPEDVRALAEVLRDPQCGFFDSVAVSVDEAYLDIRDRLATLFMGRDPDDMLLLYYSGHGILGRGNRLYLATGETQFAAPQARGIAAAELRDLMDQTRAERQVFVLDCCHSGAFAPGARGEATAVTTDTFGADSTGRYVLTASDAQQFAWDGDRLASGDTAARHLSQFTTWLVAGLGEGAASPDESHISMDALFRYLCRQAKAAGSQATPQRFVDRGSDDFVIARNPRAAAAASVSALAATLLAPEWDARLAAVEALARLARNPATREAARDALADRVGAERDFKVRAAMLRGLERAPEPPEPDIAGRHPAAPDANKPAPPPPQPPTTTLDQTVREALEARAAKHARWFWWSVWTSVVLDLGTINLATKGDPGGYWVFTVQIVASVLSLIPNPLVRTVLPGAGVLARLTVVKAGWVVYERSALHRASWLLLAAGLATLVASMTIAANHLP